MLFNPGRTRNSEFPFFGVDQVNGEASTDDQNPPTGSAPARNTRGNGTHLEWHNGILMSDITISEDIEEIDTEIEREKSDETEMFLAQSGFSKS